MIPDRALVRGAASVVATCPDCGAQRTRGGFVHAHACPVAVGVDRATDGDRRWFERHPRATERVRPVTWAEAAEMEMSLGWRPVGNVHVRQLRPGVRTRHFREAQA